MIDWGRIFYGAVLSTVIAAVVLIVRRVRDPLLLVVALASTFLGPLTWNAILHRTGGAGFFVDIPFKPFPVSWQDTGSASSPWPSPQPSSPPPTGTNRPAGSSASLQLSPPSPSSSTSTSTDQPAPA